MVMKARGTLCSRHKRGNPGKNGRRNPFFAVISFLFPVESSFMPDEVHFPCFLPLPSPAGEPKTKGGGKTGGLEQNCKGKTLSFSGKAKKIPGRCTLHPPGIGFLHLGTEQK
jgi:hypothetical protein